MIDEDQDPVLGFVFGRDEKKRMRSLVNEQEEEGARLIGGRRHVGSGAIEGLKSDASSSRWQLEAKQTAGKSIGVSLEWLEKISREARSQDKHPILFLRFTRIPSDMVIEEDWMVIPASVFERMDLQCRVIER
jgi:hypothetical protein